MISKEKNYKVNRDNANFLSDYASQEGIKSYWKDSANIDVHEPFQGKNTESTVISRKNVINKTGDGSITPKTHIHETTAYLDRNKSTFVTEYAYVKTNQKKIEVLQSFVPRFGINVQKIKEIKNTNSEQIIASATSNAFSNKFSKINNYLKENIVELEAQETKVLEYAIKYLQDTENNAVVFDIFERNFCEESKNIKSVMLNKNESHSVVLLKSEDNSKYFVIDPNKTQFSCFLHQKTLNKVQLFVPNKQCEIYTPKKADVGNNINQWRDCIDIAVKLAFLFNSSVHKLQTIPEDMKKFTISDWDEVKLISNRSSIDKNIIEEKKNSAAFRIKQTSNIELIKLYSELLKSGINLLQVFDSYDRNDLMENLYHDWSGSFEVSLCKTLDNLKICLKAHGFDAINTIQSDINKSTKVIGESESSEGCEQ